MQQWYTQLALALFTGGVGVKVIELFFGRGRSLRDELRHEIARLETRIKELDSKVNVLEDEIEQWKGKAEEWRNRYYALQQRHQAALLQLQIRDEHIRRLRLLVRQFTARLKEAAPDEDARELYEAAKEETEDEPD